MKSPDSGGLFGRAGALHKTALDTSRLARAGRLRERYKMPANRRQNVLPWQSPRIGFRFARTVRRTAGLRDRSRRPKRSFRRRRADPGPSRSSSCAQTPDSQATVTTPSRSETGPPQPRAGRPRPPPGRLDAGEQGGGGDVREDRRLESAGRARRGASRPHAASAVPAGSPGLDARSSSTPPSPRRARGSGSVVVITPGRRRAGARPGARGARRRAPTSRRRAASAAGGRGARASRARSANSSASRAARCCPCEP